MLPSVDIDTPEPSSISLVSSNTSNNDAVEVVQESNQVKVEANCDLVEANCELVEANCDQLAINFSFYSFLVYWR